MGLARSPRLRVIAELVTDGGPGATPVVDIGADHGRLANALGALAVERLPHRRAATSGVWLISDGLTALRGVGTAVVAGMGADRIAGILATSDATRAVLHAQDDPARLRVWLATHGWRIVDERVAPEGRGWAEIIAAERGTEPTTGAELRLGPRLAARRADPDVAAAWAARRSRLAAELAEIEAAGHPAPREREEDLARLDAWVSDGQGPPGDAILRPPDR